MLSLNKALIENLVFHRQGGNPPFTYQNIEGCEFNRMYIVLNSHKKVKTQSSRAIRGILRYIKVFKFNILFLIRKLNLT